MQFLLSAMQFLLSTAQRYPQLIVHLRHAVGDASLGCEVVAVVERDREVLHDAIVLREPARRAPPRSVEGDRAHEPARRSLRAEQSLDGRQQHRAVDGLLEGALGARLPRHREVALAAAAGSIFQDRAGGADVEEIVAYFEEGGALQVSEDAAAQACVEAFHVVPGLLDLVKDLGLAPNSASSGLKAAACELVLEGLAGEKRISRTEGGYGRARHQGTKSPGGSLGFEGF